LNFATADSARARASSAKIDHHGGVFLHNTNEQDDADQCDDAQLHVKSIRPRFRRLEMTTCDAVNSRGSPLQQF
jgi:hypothetical protein